MFVCFLKAESPHCQPVAPLLNVVFLTSGFYHQSFEDGSLINFQMLTSGVKGDMYELEMGKVSIRKIDKSTRILHNH